MQYKPYPSPGQGTSGFQRRLQFDFSNLVIWNAVAGCLPPLLHTPFYIFTLFLLCTLCTLSTFLLLCTLCTLCTLCIHSTCVFTRHTLHILHTLHTPFCLFTHLGLSHPSQNLGALQSASQMLVIGRPDYFYDCYLGLCGGQDYWSCMCKLTGYSEEWLLVD